LLREYEADRDLPVVAVVETAVTAAGFQRHNARSEQRGVERAIRRDQKLGDGRGVGRRDVGFRVGRQQAKRRRCASGEDGIRGRSAIGDPLPDRVDGFLRQRRAAERHASADRGRALDLLNQVAVVRIAWLDAQERGHLDARHVDEHRLRHAFLEPQALRRAGAGVTGRADRREDIVLDRLQRGFDR
jgi:hypothetical protein